MRGAIVSDANTFTANAIQFYLPEHFQIVPFTVNRNEVELLVRDILQQLIKCQ